MIDVCLLGTGGMMPLPYRWLTSMMLRYNGKQVLVDCGEGTQITIRKRGWSFKAIDVICFTHYHADHISGLPGLLLSIGNSDRTEPITLIGPKGLARVVNGLRVIAPELPFEIECIELSDPIEDIHICGLEVQAFFVKHNVPCYGYSFVLKRQGRFDAESAKANGIPLRAWSVLQKGEVVEVDGVTYTPDMVMGPMRKGIKISYCTDTRPTERILECVYESDLFICEGMYGDEEDGNKAHLNKHMTMREAVALGQQAKVKRLWLTHYSPSVPFPSEYEAGLKAIFAPTVMGKDRMTEELVFED